ncbi:F-box protein CPR1-like isoform X2 [Tripterygium wilfordii]|uniref:F-box protein CPR1-like isoform X2 n=1 Tax=Tripterygium wilfordii TaxID=458696 RepID=UPI0018F8252F|nr:F-box protein CPR1-like isoform X2 [Tripterygium wilfordii]
MTRLPLDLVTDILLRQPVKSLLRFKCVCKIWCSTIDGPDFVKLHLEGSLKNGSNLSLMFKSLHLYSIGFESLNTGVELDHHPLWDGFGCETEVVGSCNGLVLLENSPGKLALYNYSTRKYHQLPVEPIRMFERESDDPPYICYGFGYDSVNDDYKVVRMVLGSFWDSGEGLSSPDAEVGVYSLKSDSWRRVFSLLSLYRPFYHKYFHRWCGVLAGGALHWVSPRDPVNDRPNFIIGFDLRSEEFYRVSQPDYETYNFDLDLSVLGGCLSALCNYNSQCVDVWVMKEYGVKESWTKLFKVEQPRLQFLKALAYSEKGDQVLFLKNEEKLVWYDLQEKRTRRVRTACVLGSFSAQLCLGSLVPLSRSKGAEKLLDKKEKRNKNNRQFAYLL